MVASTGARKAVPSMGGTLKQDPATLATAIRHMSLKDGKFVKH